MTRRIPLLVSLAIGLAVPPASAEEALRQLAVSAHHQAQGAASDLDRIDDQLAAVPDPARREEMRRQRELLEEQLARELESVRRLAERIAALERQVSFEGMHGATLPGPPIEAHPAGPEPAVPKVPLGVPPVPEAVGPEPVGPDVPQEPLLEPPGD